MYTNNQGELKKILFLFFFSNTFFSWKSRIYNKKPFFIIRIESLNVNGRTTLGQSISINDDNGQMSYSKTDTDDKKLSKTTSNILEKSKNINADLEQIQKTLSNPNVFSRLMNSEPHVQ